MATKKASATGAPSDEATPAAQSAPARMLFGVPRKPTGYLDIVTPEGATTSYPIPDLLTLTVEQRINVENARGEVQRAFADRSDDREQAILEAVRAFVLAAVPSLTDAALAHLTARDVLEMYEFVLRTGATAGAREEAARPEDPPSRPGAASGGIA